MHALSFQWGPWADVGMAARHVQVESGLNDVAVELGSRCLGIDAVSLGDTASVGVVSANWANIVCLRGTVPPLFKTLISRAGDQSRVVMTTASPFVARLLSVR
jgi:hypothetical protein